MKKSNVYTRGGDNGETSLVSGTRISKGHEQIDLYGQVDQLNSEIGYFLSLYLNSKDYNKDLESLVLTIQNVLFDLGSLLACEPDSWGKYNLQLINQKEIILIENMIDKLDEELPDLKNFILPGGSPAGAYAHVVRTTCRKVERLIISYRSSGNVIPDNSLEFLNRMSDLFFVVARYVNFKLQVKEIIWKKN